MVTVLDVAVKDPVLAPALTVTLEGTPTLALFEVSATRRPPAGAAPVSVREQEDVDEEPMVPGVQFREFRVTTMGCESVIAPFVPDPVMVLPLASAPVTPLIVIGMFVAVLPAEIENVALATVPLPIVFAFSPYATQVAGVPDEHVTLLPADVAAEPATTVTPVTSEGYDMVHCKLAGEVPVEDAVTLSVTLAPALLLPELSATATCWATNGAVPQPEMATHPIRMSWERVQRELGVDPVIVFPTGARSSPDGTRRRWDYDLGSTGDS